MGQRGRLPALGYFESTTVILGLSEIAAVHFLLRPHDTILSVITQFRVRSFGVIRVRISDPRCLDHGASKEPVITPKGTHP